MKKSLPLLLAALTLLATVQLAHARMRPIPISDRVAASALIVEAKVTAVTSVEIEKETYTQVELTIASTLKGKSDKTITLLLPTNSRRIHPPTVDSSAFYLLNPKSTDKTPTYELAQPFSMFYIVDLSEAEELKAAIAAEKEKNK